MEQAGFACPGDQYPYGDYWQMTDFAAQLGFSWFSDEPKNIDSPKASTPVLKEILEQNSSLLLRDKPEVHTLLRNLPCAFSSDYIRRLLKENNIQTFHFENQTPLEIIKTVHTHRRSVKYPECDTLCQRLSVLSAFCAFWLSQGNAWNFLHYATYEPLYCSYEKPTDIYVLHARAAITDFTKRHRALKDLNRLIELEPDNRTLYQSEIEK